MPKPGSLARTGFRALSFEVRENLTQVWKIEPALAWFGYGGIIATHPFHIGRLIR
jgi:hypothetical protein